MLTDGVVITEKMALVVLVVSGRVRPALLRDPAVRVLRRRPRRQRARPLRPQAPHHGRRPRPHQLQLTGRDLGGIK